MQRMTKNDGFAAPEFGLAVEQRPLQQHLILECANNDVPPHGFAKESR